MYSYLRPSKTPPRGGKLIADIDDLRDDILIKINDRKLSEIRTLKIDPGSELLIPIGRTTRGYLLTMIRVYDPDPNSIEVRAIKNYPPSWREPFLKSAEDYRAIDRFLNERYPEGFADRISPAPERIFRALELCPLPKLKVVIIGQDPYTNDIADGLAFSVRPEKNLLAIKAGESLRNIFAEAKRSYPNFKYRPQCGDLTRWAEQGVLLLNAALTTELGNNTKAGAHKDKWNGVIYNILNDICQKKDFVVFVLWGSHAKKIAEKVDLNPGYKILTSRHPSTMSYAPGAADNFAGCGHFLKINEALIEKDIEPINWDLID